MIEYVLTGELVANEELVEKNRDQELTFKFDVDSLMSLDNGQTVTSIKDHLEAWLAGAGVAAQEGVEVDLLNPTTRISIADVWVEFTELTVNLTVKKKYYLKYLTPSEYSQMRDHVRDTTLPLHISISGPSQPDESFTEILTVIFLSPQSLALFLRNGQLLSAHKAKVNRISRSH